MKTLMTVTFKLVSPYKLEGHEKIRQDYEKLFRKMGVVIKQDLVKQGVVGASVEVKIL